MPLERIARAAIRVARTPFRVVRRLMQSPAQDTPAPPAQHPLISADGSFNCPVCDTTLTEFMEFKPSESRPGRKALCPVCWSLERTRAILLYLRNDGHKYLDGQMLHFAPEKGLETWLRSRDGLELITTDLMKEDVDVQADITDLPFEDGRFSLIYCSNVLEHIPDDAAAMGQLRRVLKPNGLAIIQVPICEGPTVEDPSVTDPAERDRLFGQADHVRWYGADIKERLEAAGFVVQDVHMPDHLGLSTEDEVKYGVQKRELIHFCVAPE